MSRSHPARAALALPLLLVLLSCADQGGPLLPIAETPSSASLSIGQARLLACPTSDVQTVTGVIGVGGGSLAIGGHEIVVPKGAISSPQRFEIEVRSSPYLVVAFRATGHDHFEFEAPVRLTLSYSRCGAEAAESGALSVYYVDGETLTILEDVGGVIDPEASSITAATDHLSDYAVGSPQ